MSYARCELEGFTTKDAIVRATKTGKFITSFSVAVSFGDGDNKKTSFFDIDTWSNMPELIKGTLVKCTGYLTQETWEDKSGNKRSKIKLVAKTVEILRTANSQPTKESCEYKIEELGVYVNNASDFESQETPF